MIRLREKLQKYTWTLEIHHPGYLIHGLNPTSYPNINSLGSYRESLMLASIFFDALNWL